MGAKTCPKCVTEKTLDEFANNKGMKDGKHSYCKPCYLEYDRARWGKRKKGSQARYFKVTYNLSLTEIDQMLEAQGGVCAVCAEEPKRPVVDHCHDTGKVRGILCDTCNRSMGLFKDNVEVLMAAAAYLIQHEDVLSTVGGE